MKKRLLVCSDIHGQYNEFVELLDKSNYTPAHDQLILLGDYVDRGPKSRDVIRKVIELVEKDGAIALRGNHDDWFIRCAPPDNDAEEVFQWLTQGGSETASSYDNNTEEFISHAKWMDKHLRYFHETEKYIFVHAGVRPGVPLRWQTKEDLLWIRHQLPCGLGKLIVHGHTPVNEVTKVHDQLFIDTGCVFDGKLTMLDLPSGEIFEVGKHGESQIVTEAEKAEVI